MALRAELGSLQRLLIGDGRKFLAKAQANMRPEHLHIDVAQLGFSNRWTKA